MDSREGNSGPIEEAIDLFNRIQLAVNNEEKVRCFIDGKMRRPSEPGLE